MESNYVSMVGRAEDEDGPFYTIKQVAERVGVHPDTIRRWGQKLGIPNHRMNTGSSDSEAFVWCYTEEDIRALSKCKKN